MPSLQVLPPSADVRIHKSPVVNVGCQLLPSAEYCARTEVPGVPGVPLSDNDQENLRMNCLPSTVTGTVRTPCLVFITGVTDTVNPALTVPSPVFETDIPAGMPLMEPIVTATCVAPL